eukprot:3338795-Rhodomonas_salina.5
MKVQPAMLLRARYAMSGLAYRMLISSRMHKCDATMSALAYRDREKGYRIQDIGYSGQHIGDTATLRTARYCRSSRYYATRWAILPSCMVLCAVQC